MSPVLRVQRAGAPTAETERRATPNASRKLEAIRSGIRRLNIGDGAVLLDREVEPSTPVGAKTTAASNSGPCFEPSPSTRIGELGPLWPEASPLPLLARRFHPTSIANHQNRQVAR